jgi:hypothetical protein
MTANAFLTLLETTEPCFDFRGKEYQICTISGRFLVGFSDNEDSDQWFDTAEDLLNNWELDGIPLRKALPEINYG